MAPPLAGLTVLDLTSGPIGALATTVLSDFGANVIDYEDPVYNALNNHPAKPMLSRGKRASRQPIHNAVKDADVVVISKPNSLAGCSYEELERINPALIYCEITACGPDTPMPLYEGVVAAMAGRMKSFEGILPEPGPIYSAVQVASHATSQNAVTGILAALYERNRDGHGQRVATSLLQGLMPYDQGLSLALQVNERKESKRQRPDPFTVMPTLNYHPVQCADGRWIQLGNLLPHLFENFMNAIGLSHLMEKLPDEREMVRDAILETMQSRTSDEWMQLFMEDGGIAAHPYQTSEEALNDPDLTENGHVITLDNVRQLGPLARFTETPAEIGVRDKPWERIKSPGPGEAAPDTSPLRGVTVVELATIIAAPMATSFLADLGARVIKVETVGGDPYRNMGGGLGGTRCNQGKESIGVDLKTEEGKDVIKKLVSEADILIHNFRPGVPERLGIGYDELSRVNPEIVYLSANGYGAAGPGAHRPSTHPIPGAALGGAGYQAGGTPEGLLDNAGLRETARRLMRANEVNPDPNTAVVICTSALIGLLGRERTGKGQQIFTDMMGANAWANFDDFLSYDGKPSRPALDKQLKGIHPLYRLYACEEGWVFLGLKFEHEWEAFCEITGATHLLSHDPNPFKSWTDSLEEEVESVLTTQSARHWEDLLLPHGIGCVVADRYNLGEFFYHHCHAGSPWMIQVSDPKIGEYYRHRAMINFSRSRTRPRAGSRGGGDTRTLLKEFGYDEEWIDHAFERNILWQELD